MAEMVGVSRWVLAQYPNARELTRVELSQYAKNDPVGGWLVPFEHKDLHFNLQVVIYQDFPWIKPRVYCSEKFKFKQIPHIESDGAFCLYPPGTEHDPLNPKGLVRNAIREAAHLIVASFDGAFLHDFADEFDSYWSKSEGGKTVVSLLSPGGPSRSISLWRSSGDYYLADDDEVLAGWLRKYTSGKKTNYEFQTATHLVLKRPIFPEEFPRSGAAIVHLVKRLAPEGLSLLESAAGHSDGKFTVSFEGRTEDGPVLFAVEVTPPTQQSMPAGIRPDMLQKGFRPGKVPPHIRVRRQLGGNRVEHHEVVRADPSWIHGRDTLGVAALFGKRVLMIGAGSLGSEVAQLLAKTGVGSIVLVDPELLDYPNVGRHVLGVAEVRTAKAKSLADRLATNYPHMRSIGHFAERWQAVYEKRPDVFHGVDLIVSSVGSWLVEGRLNQVARTDANFPPVLYGWAEPFSVAGHAVLIGSEGPCLSCGMDQFGRSLQAVCDWAAATTRKQPHCGASFQPYGPISLANVAALVAKTAVKALLGEVVPGNESVCWASHKEIVENGGIFSASFLEGFPVVPEFGGTHVVQWKQKDGCRFCGAP
jgi:sulfur-carrier protein adenylyltransferase/sulfurtransferase